MLLPINVKYLKLKMNTEITQDAYTHERITMVPLRLSRMFPIWYDLRYLFDA